MILKKKDEEEVRQILKRYKEAEAVKAAEVAAFRKERAAKKAEDDRKVAEAKARALEVEKKREAAWKAREQRVDKKRDAWLEEIRTTNATAAKAEVLKAERKLEFIKDLHVERQKVFKEQFEKSQAREKCAEETKAEGESRRPSIQVDPEADTAAPPAEGGAAGKKAPKQPKEKTGRIDAVEQRMRDEMLKAKAVYELDQKREEKTAQKFKERLQKAAENAKGLRTKAREEKNQQQQQRDQKMVVLEQRQEEDRRAKERDRVAAERKEALRTENITKKQQARESTADCIKPEGTDKPAETAPQPEGENTAAPPAV